MKDYQETKCPPRMPPFSSIVSRGLRCSPSSDHSEYFSVSVQTVMKVEDDEDEGWLTGAGTTPGNMWFAAGERWPLLIDPQLQGIKWIKSRYGNTLKVVSLGQRG